MKEPKIRFKGFKGEWEKKKLGAMTSVRGGYAFQSSLFQKYGIPVVRISNILSNGNVGGDFVYYPRLDGDTNITIHEKDVVIAMSGATTGKIARADVGDGILYQNQRVGLFTKTGKVDYDFLYTVLNRPHFNELLNKLLTSSAQPNASSADIESIEMEFPEDAEEQKALSNYILSLDSLIQSTTKKIESLKQVKAASLQSMFPQDGETTPRVRFKGFEGEWEKVKVRDIFYITRGYVLAMNLVSLTKNRINRYAVYSSQTKNNGLAGYYNNYLYEDSITWTTDGANAGDVNYRPGKFYCTNVCGVLISKEGYANKCIAECLNLVTKHYVSYVGNPKLMNNTMSEIDILIPPIQKEQQKISDYFTNLDRQITLHTQRLEKLKQIKAACLDKMFV